MDTASTHDGGDVGDAKSDAEVSRNEDQSFVRGRWPSFQRVDPDPPSTGASIMGHPSLQMKKLERAERPQLAQGGEFVAQSEVGMRSQAAPGPMPGSASAPARLLA